MKASCSEKVVSLMSIEGYAEICFRTITHPFAHAIETGRESNGIALLVLSITSRVSNRQYRSLI